MFKVNDSDKLFEGYTFIDLFCGIGGFHLALSSLGAKCVFASDINKAASEVYYNNFGIKPQGDIKKITCAEIPSHDILCAGFPCQPFSISGSKKGFNDPNGKLFFDIIRIARFHKPKVILLENVKNLEKHDDGETLKTIIDKLDKVGYRVFCKVLNSADYGVPQSRKRIYIDSFVNRVVVFDDCIELTLNYKDGTKRIPFKKENNFLTEGSDSSPPARPSNNCNLTVSSCFYFCRNSPGLEVGAVQNNSPVDCCDRE